MKGGMGLGNGVKSTLDSCLKCGVNKITIGCKPKETKGVS